MKNKKIANNKLINIFLYIAVITPLLVFSGVIFPYIATKAIFFRILIELVLILVLWLVLKGRISLISFKNNYFFWVFGGLILIEIIAAILGESFFYSFFGDLERMWGIFTVLHIFLFYIFVRGFFKEKEWRIFFHSSIAVSLLVSIYGIVQRFPEVFNIYVFEAGIGRITSTLGNPTYVAIYLLFNIFFAVYLWLNNANKNWRYFYIIAIIIDFFAFSLTDIRGAYLGLALGLSLATILYLFLGYNKKTKLSLTIIIVLCLAGGILAFTNSTNAFVQKIPIINRLSTISINEVTAQTRFIGWQAAWEIFKEKPLTGVGMENYNVAFNKYFKARYYNLASSETYFDRAHNQFLNILAESGIFALIFYLGFPIFLAFYLTKGYKNSLFSLNEFLAIVIIVVAYFVHLIFVFDDLNSLLFFIVLICFVEFQYNKNNFFIISSENSRKKPLLLKAVLLLIILLIIAIGYNLNVKNFQAIKLAASAYMSKDFNTTINYYNKTFNLKSIPVNNIVHNYSNFLISLVNDPTFLENQNEEDKNLIFEYVNKAKTLLQKEISRKPNDVSFYIKLGKLNNLEYLLSNDMKFIEEAINNLELALQLSPERLEVYYVISDSYVISNQNDKAIVILEEARDLNPDFSHTYYYLGRTYLAQSDDDRSYENVNKAIMEMGFTPPNNKILLLLAQDFAKKDNYKKVIDIYNIILKFEPKNTQIMSALAAAYVQNDQYEKAIETAIATFNIDPDFKEEANLLIYLIEEGRIDELKEMTK